MFYTSVCNLFVAAIPKCVPNAIALGGLVKASRAGDVITKAQMTLEKSLEKVRPAAQFIIRQLRKLHDAPDEIQVAFGLKLSAEAGTVLASAGAEANYTVMLKWVKENEKVEAKKPKPSIKD